MGDLAEKSLSGLRQLRLWHWKKALQNRASQGRHETYADEFEKAHPGKVNRYNRGIARTHARNANFHLGAVQSLNDLFPMGDTAEQDAAKETA